LQKCQLVLVLMLLNIIASLALYVYSLFSLFYFTVTSLPNEAERSHEVVISIRDAASERSKWAFRSYILLALIGLAMFFLTVFELLISNQASLEFGPFLFAFLISISIALSWHRKVCMHDIQSSAL
jgi:hypothetical protein